MGVGRAIDITAEQRKVVMALLEQHLPGTGAWAYGSRAKWTSQPRSDLDMVVFTTAEQNNQVGALRDAFEESSLPFRVDLFEWDSIPEEFRQQIRAEHVVIAEKKERDETGEWRKIPFAELLSEPVRNGIYKKKEFHGRGVNIVNMGELFAYPRLRNVAMRRLELSDQEKHRFSVLKGDLLFARRSLVAEGAGKCSVVLDIDEPTVFESSIIRARPDPNKADSLFLYYFFNSPLGLHLLDSIRRQVAVAGITGSDLAQLSIPTPPISEQRTISHILGTMDDKIELNRRSNETLEAMARALFKSWFVDFYPVSAKMEGRWRKGESLPGLPAELYDLFPDRLVDSELGEIPEGWEVKPLREISSLNTESWSRRNTPIHIEYVDLASTKWGVIESTQRFLWKDAPSRARRILRSGDTIVATVRPGNGSYSLIANDGLTGSTGFAVLRPLRSRFRELVFLSATAPDNIDRLAHRADGAAYPAIRSETVSQTEVAIPIVDTRVLNRFSKIAGAILDRMESAREVSRSLVVQRDTLRSALVSGKVRVRFPFNVES